MPNKHAAIKDLRKNRKRSARNERARQHVRFLIKKSQGLLASGNKSEARQAIQGLQQAIDKAAKTGVISFNKAARKKSALMKALSSK